MGMSCKRRGIIGTCHNGYFVQIFQKHDDLPDPEGPLSSKVPSSSILSANKDVKTRQRCK